MSSSVVLVDILSALGMGGQALFSDGLLAVWFSSMGPLEATGIGPLYSVSYSVPRGGVLFQRRSGLQLRGAYLPPPFKYFCPTMVCFLVAALTKTRCQLQLSLFDTPLSFNLLLSF